jgi:uncharacterized protein (TIGR02594 family)
VAEIMGFNVVCPWMDIAKLEIGQCESLSDVPNPRIIEYHSKTTLDSKLDATAWCASFVTWVLDKSKMKNMKSAWAKDYLNYGIKLDSPIYGCLVILSRGQNSGHVAFFNKENADGTLNLLGGNQDNQVKYKDFPKDHVLGYRWPVSV